RRIDTSSECASSRPRAYLLRSLTTLGTVLRDGDQSWVRRRRQRGRQVESYKPSMITRSNASHLEPNSMKPDYWEPCTEPTHPLFCSTRSSDCPVGHVDGQYKYNKGIGLHLASDLAGKSHAATQSIWRVGTGQRVMAAIQTELTDVKPGAFPPTPTGPVRDWHYALSLFSPPTPPNRT
ncbi:hypothetical protein J6590_096169, partial [Homalodisca vitripennis]